MRGLGAATLAVAVSLGAVALSGCAGMSWERSRLVKTPDRCVDQTVQVYFDPWSAQLTPEGGAVIKAAADSVRGCRISSVEVLGLADAAGGPQVNLELSRHRADAVSQALAAAGLPSAEFRVAAAGQAGSVTLEGAAKPLRRRVDVTLHIGRP